MSQFPPPPPAGPPNPIGPGPGGLGPGGSGPGGSGMPFHPAVPGQPAHRRKKSLLWILVGVGVTLALCCAGGAIVSLTATDKVADKAADLLATPTPTTAPPASPGGSGTGPTSGPPRTAVPPPAAPPAAPPEARVGAVVRDGEFEFVVHKVECGHAMVGGEYLNKAALGQFCLVTLSVKNVGTEPRLFSDSNQEAFSEAGAKYASDSSASLYANADQEVFLAEINPGNTLRGTIVFDIPKDARIARLELHDSAFSAGAKVRVG